MTVPHGRLTAATSSSSTTAAAFGRLVLGIAHHLPHLLNHYMGPSTWLEAVEAAPPAWEQLRDEAVAVATAGQKSDLPARQREWLLRQIRACLWLIRSQLGERIIFKEQVRLLLDLQAESVDADFFQTAHEALAAVLPASSIPQPLAEQWADWQQRYTLPAAAAQPYLEQVLAQLRQQWSVAEEGALQVCVTDTEAAIRYQAGVLYVPAAMGLRLDRVYHLAVRWGYGGVHTVYTAVKQRYAAGQGDEACAVFLNVGPQQVLAQGLPLAVLAGLPLYEAGMLPHWLKAAGLPAIPAERLQAIHAAEAALQWADANAALMLHGEGLRPRAIRRWLMANKLVDRETADTQLARLTDPVTAVHVFASLVGGPLIQTWLAQGNHTLAELLYDPPAPSAMLFDIRFAD